MASLSTCRRSCDAASVRASGGARETVADRSRLPAEAIEAVRSVLAGETLVPAEDVLAIEPIVRQGPYAVTPPSTTSSAPVT